MFEAKGFDEKESWIGAIGKFLGIIFRQSDG
jgi:hypothetical protein